MIIDNPLFADFVLPFLLVFVLTFAILERSGILGKEKNQLNSILALTIALILVITPFARDFVVQIMPYLAMGLAVLLVFFTLYGFVAGDMTAKDAVPSWLKTVLLVVTLVFVVGVVFSLTGLVTWIQTFFESKTWENFFILVVIVVAMAVALKSGVVPTPGKKDK